jgi:hypothetical protein
MPFDDALFSFLHLLVFVYWLGGDLGAFYASHALTTAAVPADHRLFAAKIVGDVDMAPRSALILALPTGLLLADAKGWIDAPLPALLAITALSVAWLFLAWRLHLSHGVNAAMKGVDSIIRWSLLAGLTATAVAGLAGGLSLPFFLLMKLLLLAGAVALGLAIRQSLKPLGQALAGLKGENPARAEQDLAAILKRARPMVVAIWLLISSAAILGLATPA